jgi:hypothetical protein
MIRARALIVQATIMIAVTSQQAPVLQPTVAAGNIIIDYLTVIMARVIA